METEIPILFGPKRRWIHPATDYLDGKLWFGINVIVQMPGEDEEEEVKEQEVVLLISSERDVIYANDESELRKHGLRIKSLPIFISRWSPEGLKMFMERRVNPDRREPLDRIVGAFRKYIDFYDEREYELVALWTIGTYLTAIFRSYAYLGLSGVKRSGKSKVLDVLSLLSFNAINSADISDSSIYRLVDTLRATVLMDEAHVLEDRDRKAAQKNLLYCGYKRGKMVYRSDKTPRGIMPVGFELYSPKAWVTFKGAEEILADRSIPITMIRTDKPVGNVEVREDDPFWQETRDLLYLWAMEHYEGVKREYDTLELPPEITGRQREIWAPILALAKYISHDLYMRMLALAIEKIQAHKIEDTMYREIKVLEALILMSRDWTTDVNEVTHAQVKEVVHSILEAEEDKKFVTTQSVGRVMAHSFGFKSVKRGKKLFRVVSRERVYELAKRYGLDPEEILKGEEDVFRNWLYTVVDEKTGWETIAREARERFGMKDPSKLFKLLDELSEKKNISYNLNYCFFEGDRTESGKRICGKYGVRCAVVNPEKCPLGD